MFILQTVFEFLVAGFIIWGLFNENKLIKFEDRVIDSVKIHLNKNAKNRNIYHHESHHQHDDRTCA